MTGLFDSLSGVIEEQKTLASDEDVSIVNSLKNPPPVKVGPDDIYVRKCRLTGDGINCHFGRFHTEDLKMMLEKTQGVSCLIGHRKDTAGIARFFGGTIEKRPARDIESGKIVEMSFIIPKIYWMKSHSQAQDIRLNIDGGIYHQASISWYFEKPACGICGKDIRSCDHVPGKVYGGRLCFFWYEKIGEVLEGSIVYAGGHPGTGFEIDDSVKKKSNGQKELFKVDHKGKIDKDDILPYLQNIDHGSIYLVGDLATQGWTDKAIEIMPEPHNLELAGELLPLYLTDRLKIHSSFEMPGVCVKVNKDSVVEMESLSLPGITDKSQDSLSRVKDTRPDSAGLSISFSDKFDTKPRRRAGKVYSLSDVAKENRNYIVTPCFGGLAVNMSFRFDKAESSEHEKKTLTVDLPVKYYEQGILNEIMKEISGWNIGDFDISGEILTFRGKSRFDFEEALNSSKGLPGNLKFILKIADFKTLKGNSDGQLSSRLDNLSALISDSESVQIISHDYCMGKEDVIRSVQSMATREGALIIPDESDYDSMKRMQFYSTKMIVDIVVLNAREKAGGFVYDSGFIDNGRETKIGATHITSENYVKGDILRVEVDFVNYSNGAWNWKNPRVLRKLYGEKTPDSVDVLKHIYSHLFGETLADKGETQGLTCSCGVAVECNRFRLGASEDSNDDSLFLEVPGKDNTEVFCIKQEFLDLVNCGKYCPGFRKNESDSSFTAGSELKENSKNALDKGGCVLLESNENLRKYAFAGNLLNGVFVFLRLSGSSNNRWYIYKK